MGFTDEVWRLLRGDELLGEIAVDQADFPWLNGRFHPTPAFAGVRPLFDRTRELADAEQWEEFDLAYDLIADTLTLAAPAGPVAEFLLHIDGDRASFRWSDEPFDDLP
ncbi:MULTISPECIES: hypothetical protein [Kitasatospora]|uniref:Uncharacterized protein n=2 Tax=Kitasatospora TaxID=2063 RepID=A0ABT1IQ27_9ACTN|nr:hypothetical protein [Kitasatospora paracochleata]MCP2307235.1 hypothetical protein [Kitasatospora paracochleata]